MIDVLAMMVNAEYYPVLLDDGSWGVMYRTGYGEGLVYDDGDVTFHEAVLLARAHNNGAETYLDACDLEPELRRYWNKPEGLHD